MSLSLAAGAAIGGAVVDMGSRISQPLMEINQAKKNRAFQERMYKQQVEDNKEFWLMQQRWNLPSAQVQRLKDAHLNPLLMYGEGSPSLVASTQPQAAQAPAGSKANIGDMRTQFAQALQQAALINAQIRNINADSEQKETAAESNRQQAQNLEQDVLLKRLTKDMNVQIRFREWDLMNTTIDEMRNRIWNEKNLSIQNVLSLMQGREYQIKNYELTKWQVGAEFRLGLLNVENGRLQASAALKQAAAAWKHAINEANLTNAQIGEINQRIFQSRKIFPELYKQARWTTTANQLNTVMDFILKGTQINETQANTIKTQMQTLRIGLGNDTGIGSFLAPFSMPVGAYKDFQQRYNELLNGNH